MANNVLWNNTFLKPLCQSGVVPTPELSLWQGLHSTFLLLSPDLLLLSPDAWGWFPRWQSHPLRGVPVQWTSERVPAGSGSTGEGFIPAIRISKLSTR